MIAIPVLFMALSASAGEVVRATVQEMQSRPGGPYVYEGNGQWRATPWWQHQAPLPKENRPPPSSLPGIEFDVRTTEKELEDLRAEINLLRIEMSAELTRLEDAPDPDVADIITDSVKRLRSREMGMTARQGALQKRLDQLERELDRARREELTER